MTVPELLDFADQILGIPIPRDTPKSKILTRIVNAAAAARDGL